MPRFARSRTILEEEWLYSRLGEIPMSIGVTSDRSVLARFFPRVFVCVRRFMFSRPRLLDSLSPRVRVLPSLRASPRPALRLLVCSSLSLSISPISLSNLFSPCLRRLASVSDTAPLNLFLLILMARSTEKGEHTKAPEQEPGVFGTGTTKQHNRNTEQSDLGRLGRIVLRDGEWWHSHTCVQAEDGEISRTAACDASVAREGPEKYRAEVESRMGSRPELIQAKKKDTEEDKVVLLGRCPTPCTSGGGWSSPANREDERKNCRISGEIATKTRPEHSGWGNTEGSTQHRRRGRQDARVHGSDDDGGERGGGQVQEGPYVLLFFSGT